ncbi:MAG: M23 family metallopeptidase [Deltaproteobacteria bacterium]|jgi:murein DD-endopeptidase MepM/ murein hydrolase activator NlpD|nr:M23 family metallopeptidase [Deltaproteobacteria bacterium]
MRVRSQFSLLLAGLVLGVIGLGLYSLFKDMHAPEITLTPNTDRLSPNRELVLTLSDPSGIRSVSVQVRKNNQIQTILDQHYTDKRQREEVKFSLKNISLREGSFDLEIKATDASWAGFGRGNTRTLTLPMRLDTQPPRVSMKHPPPQVRRGGCGTILYTVNKEVYHSGVRVGDHFFPGFRQEDGAYFCVFAFPQNLEPKQYAPELVVEDVAGNTSVNRLAVAHVVVPLKRDAINITDSFLLTKMPELQHLAQNANTPLEQYLSINRDVRAANEKTLLELKTKTARDVLWSGPFIHLPRSVERARFGDFRTYAYQGQKIDEQTHMGMDLASLPQADIPAANDGLVIFAEFLGIYGNTVIVDHGQGLMSLYAHMSKMNVAVGDVARKGQVLGLTGATGLAVGDHLHFGILLQGLEVQPLEWLDPKWIRDNIAGRMKAPTTPQR